MNTFEDSPTTDLVQELLDRIEYSNGLEFVGWDDIVTLRDALTAHLSVTRNPYTYDTSTPATFTPPRSLGVHTENRVRSIDVRQPTEAEWAAWALNNDQPSREG